MSELILYTTEDGRSQIKGGALEVVAVVKNSLTAQCSRRRVEKGLCVIAEVSLAVRAYREQGV